MNTMLQDNTLTIFLEGRIDSNNADETESQLMNAISESKNSSVSEIKIDAEKLSYISSAGLRVLLKARKKIGRTLSVLNVSNEIYDTFSVTGFTELLDVHKKMREVSVEGCEVIGEGANGTVYRLTRDEMIKVFKHNVPLEDIEEEREASRKAFLLGVPCAIAFDTVKCGDSYGTIYEIFNARTLGERIREDSTKLPELARASAHLLKHLHEIEVPEGQLPKASRALHKRIDMLSRDFSPDDVEKMHALYNSIPEMNRFIHNDYHTKNIMESNGELMLIDLGESGMGNPFLDLIHCYMAYITITVADVINRNVKATKDNPDDEINVYFGISFRQMREFWEIFIDSYFNGDQERVRLIQEKLAPYANLMHLTSALSHPLMPEESRKIYVDKLRNEVLARFDELMSYTWEI